jgi:hypothetical protein
MFARLSRRHTVKPIRRRSVPLRLEVLEDRAMPSVDLWTGANSAVDNNWSDPANWSLARTPGASDIAQFTRNGSVLSYTSVVDTDFTVAGLQIDGLWGGSINVPAVLTLASGTTNEWDSGSLNPGLGGGSVINNGTLTLNSAGGVTLTGGGSLQNNGTITQTGAGGLALAGGGNVATTLVNAAGATYDFQSDSGIGIAYFSAVQNLIDNLGLIEKGGRTGTSTIAQPLTNSGGTLDAASGTLGIAVTSNNTNGTFEAAAGAILDLTGSSNVTFTEAGAFTGAGAGTIVLTGGALDIGSGGATFNIPSTLNFQWSGGSISIPVNASLVYNGALTLNGTGGVELGGGGTFQNNGTITQIGAGGLYLAAGGNVGTTFINAAGATYDFQVDSGIGLAEFTSIPNMIENFGLIEKTGGTGTSALAQPLTNNGGTFSVTTGTLQINTNSTNTNGTYQAAAGATLDLTGGNTFSETGTFSGTGAGTITLGNGTLSVSNNAATLSLPNSLTFVWTAGYINVPTSDTLTVNGNLTFAGVNGAILSGGGTMIENGTITQAGTGNLGIAGTGTMATTLVIPTGSVYDFAANSGIVSAPTAPFFAGAGGQVMNAGTIEKTAGGGNSAINVAFSNTSGMLSAQIGTLTVESTGGENTGGVFSVTAGAILDLTGGNTVAYSGTYTGSGAGEVLLGGGTLAVTGGTNGATFNLPGNLFVWSGGTIATAAGNNFTLFGSMNIIGNGTEVVSGSGDLDVGNSTIAGTLNDLATGNALIINGGAALVIGANGTLNLADDSINGAGLLQNFGLVAKTAGTSGATISALTDNQHKVQVSEGTILFSGAVDQVFNNVLTGGSWNVVSNPTTQATLDISSASFNTIALGAVVNLSGPNSSFTNLSSLVANQGTFNLIVGASFATTGNFSNTGSMTLSPGSVLTVNGNFTDAAGSTLYIRMGGTASSPTFGSIVCTGTVSLGGHLVVTSTLMPAINSKFEIVNNESAAAIAGIFAGLPEGATFTVKVGSTTMTFKITYKGGSNSVVITRIS